ncbi:MAG TPA: hypothetical protein ENN81_08405 [Phycisphaerales bacterium]|nr:hypothetical protein [Phycisphaerales bacterium]
MCGLSARQSAWTQDAGLKSRTTARLVGAAIVLAGVCAAAAALSPEGGESQPVWYSVVPPMLAILLAFLTHHVIASLGIALLVGGLLCRVPAGPLGIGNWWAGIAGVAGCIGGTLSRGGNLLILVFIPPIFIMIEMIIASGGFSGIIRRLLRWVRGPRSAGVATVLMGILCFIDDYANAIVVGSMMQPVTDRFRISREKLAFLVDATSAPVSGLAVVSTWIAYEVGLFGDMAVQLGIDKSGYGMFFDALRFRFYCLLMLVFVMAAAILRTDFGPMRKTRPVAAGQGGAGGGDAGRTPGDGLARNALIPLAGLIGFHITGLWFDGGGPRLLRQGASVLSLGYWRDVISAARHSTMILAMAATFGLGLALVCGTVTGRLDRRAIRACLWRGLKRAVLPSIILTLAWSLKTCCDALRTGEFLAAVLAERVSPAWFPAILFLAASVTSFATGTSWGTMAILIPTTIPVAHALDGGAYGTITMISLGAVLDGAIFGDHCSPISDTTILSSVACDCPLMDHVRTQLPYSLTVAAAAVVCCYVPAGHGLSPAVGVGVGAAAIVVVLLSCRRADV